MQRRVRQSRGSQDGNGVGRIMEVGWCCGGGHTWRQITNRVRIRLGREMVTMLGRAMCLMMMDRIELMGILILGGLSMVILM
jgi:hypothetical protein